VPGGPCEGWRVLTEIKALSLSARIQTPFRKLGTIEVNSRLNSLSCYLRSVELNLGLPSLSSSFLRGAKKPFFFPQTALRASSAVGRPCVRRQGVPVFREQWGSSRPSMLHYRSDPQSSPTPPRVVVIRCCMVVAS
jgi:hypothetical protein